MKKSFDIIDVMVNENQISELVCKYPNWLTFKLNDINLIIDKSLKGSFIELVKFLETN